MPNVTNSALQNQLPALQNQPNRRPKPNTKNRVTNKQETMATIFLPSLPSTSSSLLNSSHHHIARKRPIIMCKATANDTNSPPWPFLTSRRGISINLVAATTLLLGYRGCFDANAAVLKVENDPKLMEQSRNDRKDRLVKQGAIESSDSEKGLLQDLIYKLGKVGQAIEKEDLSTATSVLGPGIDTTWVQKVNFALNQLSSTGEEKVEIDNININMASLIAAVDKNDIPTAKESLKAVTNAFKKWTTLIGLDKELKGL